jgi:hypothetical protein
LGGQPARAAAQPSTAALGPRSRLVRGARRLAESPANASQGAGAAALPGRLASRRRSRDRAAATARPRARRPRLRRGSQVQRAARSGVVRPGAEHAGLRERGWGKGERGRERALALSMQVLALSLSRTVSSLSLSLSPSPSPSLSLSLSLSLSPSPSPSLSPSLLRIERYFNTRVPIAKELQSFHRYASFETTD